MIRIILILLFLSSAVRIMYIYDPTEAKQNHFYDDLQECIRTSQSHGVAFSMVIMRKK